MDPATSTTDAPPDDRGADFRADLRTIPNYLSLTRIVGILIAGILATSGYLLTALAIGVPAAFTDTFDGYFARKLDQATPLGALLDSLADVLYSVVCLGVAISEGLWPAYLLFIWAYRDMTVMTIRASAAQQGFTVPTIFLSKVGSTTNFISFLIMALDLYTRDLAAWSAINPYLHYLGLFAIHLGLVFYLIAGSQYVTSYIRQYRSS